MKLLLSAVVLLAAAMSMTSYASEDAEQVFNQLCGSCHVTSGKPTIAPPVVGMVDHVRAAYPAKEDFVERIVAWVANPNADDALMPGAVRKFGVMPKLPYEPAKVRLVAEYLYDGNRELPEWYVEHYEEEHGKKPKAH